MRILDKHKDFYDYLAGEYGIDNTVFFDRRGSTKLTQYDLMRGFNFDWDWSDWPIETTLKEIKERDLFAIIEAGYYQYLVRASNVARKKKISNTKYEWPPYLYDMDIELVHIFDDHKHYYKAPLNFYPVRLQNYYLHKNIAVPKNLNYGNDIRPYDKNVIANPIFMDTKIPSILDAQTIYVNIFDYISSKADFDIVDTRDDVAKAVDHGFDKRTSFRNM
jgi:hypothetical protein